jgi:NADH:ubiquinone oxidoreductase subunit 3 (subunit A)
MSPEDSLLYTYIFVFLATGIVVATAPLILSRLIPPSRRPGAVTTEPYECGIATTGFAWDSRYGISYYLYALIFLAFEVDVLYLFPAVAAFDALPGAQALLLLGLFLAILSLALIYAWKKGSFEWKTPEISGERAPKESLWE